MEEKCLFVLQEYEGAESNSGLELFSFGVLSPHTEHTSAEVLLHSKLYFQNTDCDSRKD